MKSMCRDSRQLFPCYEVGHQVDNSVSTIQKLNTLYSDPELSDLNLYVGEKILRTHKLILSISSDVFKTMLTSPKWPEAYTSHIHLQEEPECIEVFEDFLRYLYTGRINLSHESVLPVLTLADKYNIGDLSQVCIDYMCSHYVAPQDQCYVISWLKYASMCGHRKLERICKEYITWNFQYVVETEDFLMITEDLLLKFLSSPDIVVKDEISLFRHIKKWILKQVNSSSKTLRNITSNLSSLVTKLCELIHFQTMPLNELQALKCDPVVKSFEDMILPHLDKAIRLHEASENRPTCQSTNGSHERDFESSTRPSTEDDAQMSEDIKVHPRIYTCDSWCTEMIVNNVDDVSPGEIRGAFFSTPKKGNEADDSACWDWHIDLYPKGVAFKKCLMIGLFENHEIDEVMYETIRLTVSVASSISEARHVKVSILVYGEQDDMEYVARVITRTCFFSRDCILHNINNIVDYCNIYHDESQYRLGKNQDTLKFMINIRPLFV